MAIPPCFRICLVLTAILFHPTAQAHAVLLENIWPHAAAPGPQAGLIWMRNAPVSDRLPIATILPRPITDAPALALRGAIYPDTAAIEDRPEAPAAVAEIPIDLPEPVALFELAAPALSAFTPEPDIAELSLQAFAIPTIEARSGANDAGAPLALAIPEPSGLALLAGALAFCAAKRPRRKPAQDTQTSY